MRERESEAGRSSRGVARTASGAALLFRLQPLRASSVSVPRPAMPMQAPSLLSLSLSLVVSLSVASVSVAKTKSTPAKKGNVFGAQIQLTDADCSSDASSDCDDNDGVTLRPFTSTRTCRAGRTE